jgi:thiosulfate dehydrogenase
MTTRTMLAVAAVAVGAALVVGGRSASQAGTPRHDVPTSPTGNLVVGLCDGQTSLEVAGVKEGETLDRAKAQAVSDALMAEWRRKNPNATWDDPPAQLAAASAPAAGDASAAGGPAAPHADRGASGAKPEPAPSTTPTGTPAQRGVYSSFGPRDAEVQRANTEAFVADGKKIFHDAKLLGGTIGVSCDMCHPDAANTHPETYPKFQVQLGRVALLRDMINWCIENPVRGKPLHDDDPRLKAMEAYILAQRKGVPLDYGTH